MAIEFSWPIAGILIPAFIITFIGVGFTFAIQIPRNIEDNGLYQLIFLMVWISYALAVFKGPGSPPRSFEPAPGEMRRWCRKCNLYKPERAHHCRQCGVCVLRMDHHCPWTMNCVGYANMPHFIRFLVWVIIGTGYTLYLLTGVAYELYQDRHLPAYLISMREVVFTIMLIPLDSFVLLTISFLFIRVVWNAFEGKTEIETWEEDRVKSLARRKLLPKVDFPYDIDPWTNIISTFGNPLICWFPLAGAPGDGLHFEKNEALDGGLVWPPDHIDQFSPKSREISTGRRESEPITLGYLKAKRALPSENDFYKRDQYVNYEGEKLADFGVDVEEEMEEEGEAMDYDRDNDNGEQENGKTIKKGPAYRHKSAMFDPANHQKSPIFIENDDFSSDDDTVPLAMLKNR